jgi:twinkle protein
LEPVAPLYNKSGKVIDKTPTFVHNSQPVVKPQPASPAGEGYLRGRGISQDTIEHFKIGDIDGKIAFPFYLDGKLQYSKLLDLTAERKGRWSATPRGATPIYYNIDGIDPSLPVIICEGEIDCLSIYDSGHYNVVSVPNGASISKEKHPEYLALSWDLFSKAEKIILAGDMDEVGLGLRENLAKIYGKDRCWLASWPEGCKDANETLQTHGPDAVARCVNEAEPYPIRSLQTARQFTDKVLDLYWNGRARGLKVGYDSVDPYYSVVTGELEIITGIPSSGKTNWIDQVNVNLSERYGTKHAVCSFENPMEQHLGILAEKRARASFAGYHDVRITEQQLRDALLWIDKHFVFIRLDDDVAPTVDTIIEQAKAAKIRYGISTLTVDPFNYIEQARKRNQTETEYVSEVLSKLRMFAQNYDVHVNLVAHPPKLLKDKEGKLNPPTGYDVAGSSHFFNKADVLTVVHRDPSVNPQIVSVIWRKVRFKMTGSPGQIEIRYNLRTGCYEEMTY